MTTLPDDILTAAVLYRRSESEAFRAEKIELQTHDMFTKHPEHLAVALSAWAAIQSCINDRYKAATPNNKKMPAPKVYEVHHEISVARECFLLALSKNLEVSGALGIDQAAEFTLRRLGQTGDIEDFYREQGFLPPQDADLETETEIGQP